ncbi:hypothetical protein ACLOJK_006446 [Asimina triloba]
MPALDLELLASCMLDRTVAGLGTPGKIGRVAIFLCFPSNSLLVGLCFPPAAELVIGVVADCVHVPHLGSTCSLCSGSMLSSAPPRDCLSEHHHASESIPRSGSWDTVDRVRCQTPWITA